MKNTFHWKTKSLYWSRNIGKIMGYKWYPMCKSWWCKTGASREMCNVNSWWVFVATHYSNMAMVGVAKCLKVFRRGTLVKNPSGAGRRSLRWETICWKCKEALGWTLLCIHEGSNACWQENMKLPARRLGHHCMHTCHDWVWRTPHFSVYTEGCKAPRSNQRFLYQSLLPKSWLILP